MSAPLVILGCGAMTAVGLTSGQTCATIRAGVPGFVEWDLSHLGDDLEPVLAALAPFAAPPRDNLLFARLLGLATAALGECLRASGLAPPRTALLLGLREPFRVHPNLTGRDEELLRAIEDELRVRFHPSSRVVPRGNAAAFDALVQARDLLAGGTVSGCVVGGVDSLVNWYDLRRFTDTYRVKREGVAQGFIPGEGAAFLAVTTSEHAGARAPSGVAVLGVGLAEEEAGVTALGDGHPTGRGLHLALRAAAQDARLPEARVGFRVSDLNGEYYRGIESMLATNRFYRTRREHLPVWLPAVSVGEIGAAIGPLLVIVALTGLVKGYAPGAVAMCEASSDAGLRAGCLVGTPAPPGN